MKKTNKLIEISSIIYITIALLLIMYFPLVGGIYLGIGISLLSYSFLKEEELKSKKTHILLFGIISIIINFISAILLFIANSEIVNTDKDIQKQENLNSENKRLDILLKIGLGMILISGILFSTTSWDTIPNIVKCIGLILLGIIFILLSKFSEQKLKIDKTTKAYFILGLFFFFLSFIGVGIFGTITNWLTYTGEGKYLTYFLTYILLSSILYIIYYKFKQSEYKYLSYICCYFSLYHILRFIGLNIPLILLLIVGLTFIISLFIKQNKTSISKIITISNYLLWPLLLVENVSEFNIIVIISSVLNLLSILYIALNKKDTFNDIIFIIISCILLTNISIRLQIGDLSIIFFTIFTIFYLFINHHKNSSIYIKTTNQIIFNILISITLCTMSDNSIKAFICSIIYCIINLISCYITNIKDSKFDLYYQPIVLSLTVASIFQILKEFININFISEGIILGIIYALIYHLIKNNKIKKIYFIALIIINSLLLLTNLINNNILDGIIILALFGYIYFKHKESLLAYIMIPISIILLKCNIVYHYDFKIISNIINILILIGLTYLFKKNNKFTKTNLLLMIIPIYSLINSVDVYSDINIILLNILYIYILSLCIYLFIHNPKTKDILYTIFISLIILNIITTNSILIGLYIGILNICIIIITYNKKEYKSLFYCGVVFTILNIIIQLGDYWEKIPFWAYLLLGGIAIIAFVTFREIKKQNEPPQIEKEVNNNQQVDKPNYMNFCPTCGTKNNGNNFCKKCGRNLNIKK